MLKFENNVFMCPWIFCTSPKCICVCLETHKASPLFNIWPLNSNLSIRAPSLRKKKRGLVIPVVLWKWTVFHDFCENTVSLHDHAATQQETEQSKGRDNKLVTFCCKRWRFSSWQFSRWWHSGPHSHHSMISWVTLTHKHKHTLTCPAITSMYFLNRQFT